MGIAYPATPQTPLLYSPLSTINSPKIIIIIQQLVHHLFVFCIIILSLQQERAHLFLTIGSFWDVVSTRSLLFRECRRVQQLIEQLKGLAAVISCCYQLLIPIGSFLFPNELFFFPAPIEGNLGPVCGWCFLAFLVLATQIVSVSAPKINRFWSPETLLELEKPSKYN